MLLFHDVMIPGRHEMSILLLRDQVEKNESIFMNLCMENCLGDIKQAEISLRQAVFPGL